MQEPEPQSTTTRPAAGSSNTAPAPDAGPSSSAAPPRKKSPARQLLFFTIVLGASFLVGVLLFNIVIMPAFVGHHDEVRVPDLTGKDLQAAEAVLSQAGLKLGDTRQRYDTHPAGTIVDQHPSPGSLVKTARTVAIIVSRGESGGVVPTLEGQTLRNAGLSLESAGLTLGEIVRVPSESVPRDGIVATEPAAGSSAAKGTAVNLLISDGSPGAAYVMPDLRGREASEAENFLKGAGFSVQVEGGGGFFRSHRVTDHTPPAGARVVAGSHVTLYTD